MTLRAVLGAIAGSILGAILGFVVWVGGATPFIRSPIEVFTTGGAAVGAFLGLRARRGMGVARLSFVTVLLAVAACAVVVFYLAQALWHERGMIHP